MRHLITLLALSSGCTGSTESETANDHVLTHRYDNREARYSLDAPDTWTVTQERGSTIFARPRSKQTIVVRSAPKPGELKEGHATTEADVVAATERGLKMLPRVAFRRRWQVKDAELSGEAFAFTFTPLSVGTSYQRTHVVLVGKTRLYHVVYTAPAGEAIANDVLEEMVAGLKEEV